MTDRPPVESVRTGLPARIAERVRAVWRDIRAWRRLSFTRGGAFFTLGAFAIGFAAINTGNNLLYLLLGAMLGTVAVSGWLSEQTIRGVHVARRVPRGVPVGAEAVIQYEVTSRKSRMTSWALEFSEEGLGGRGFVARLGPDETATATSRNVFGHRGIYLLDALTIGTDFPFGLFRKERDVRIPDELVIWPRTDRVVRTPSWGAGRRRQRNESVPALAAGPRGEYRGLREYRPGDDPRDIHWRSSARLAVPVVREYDQEAAEAVWIALDVGCPEGDEAEAAVEVAASLAAQMLRTGSPVGLAAGDHQVGPGSGPGHLEAILDQLARVEFGQSAGPQPPVPADRCVLVTTGGPSAPGAWADLYRASSIRREEPTPPRGPAFRTRLLHFLGFDVDLDAERNAGRDRDPNRGDAR